MGYTERTVLPCLVEALETISAKRFCSIVLGLRPHPREARDWLASISSESIRIKLVESEDVRSLLVSADVVVGMNTLLLVESCYLGCVTVSLQPGLSAPDALPTNAAGFSLGVYSGDEVQKQMEQALIDECFRRNMLRKLQMFRPDGKAARRVADLVYAMI
jgi:hypothetical protein